VDEFAKVHSFQRKRRQTPRFGGQNRPGRRDLVHGFLRGQTRQNGRRLAHKGRFASSLRGTAKPERDGSIPIAWWRRRESFILSEVEGNPRPQIRWSADSICERIPRIVFVRGSLRNRARRATGSQSRSPEHSRSALSVLDYLRLRREHPVSRAHFLHANPTPHAPGEPEWPAIPRAKMRRRRHAQPAAFRPALSSRRTRISPAREARGP